MKAPSIEGEGNKYTGFALQDESCAGMKSSSVTVGSDSVDTWLSLPRLVAFGSFHF